MVLALLYVPNAVLIHVYVSVRKQMAISGLTATYHSVWKALVFKHHTTLGLYQVTHRQFFSHLPRGLRHNQQSVHVVTEHYHANIWDHTYDCTMQTRHCIPRYNTYSIMVMVKHLIWANEMACFWSCDRYQFCNHDLLTTTRVFPWRQSNKGWLLISLKVYFNAWICLKMNTLERYWHGNHFYSHSRWENHSSFL